MCGLTGIWAPSSLDDGERKSLETAVSGMRRRGPDHEGVLHFDRVSLGHRRLSIIDLDDRSHQPMKSDCGRYALVYNGEIFNFRELRAGMTAKGEVFRTQGDTEVLLRGLMMRGRGFLGEINGFFAFSFYDSHENTLLLARDRFGIKPLYTAEHNDRFYFSSTLRALMDVGIPREIDMEGLALYLQLSYIPAPKTMLTTARKVLPGEWVYAGPGGVERGSFYKLPEGDHGAGEEAGDAREQLRELMSDSVRMRLTSDVPVGTFLSGGMDSAVIAALAVKAGAKPHAFSIGFPDHPYFDESVHAAATARHLGLEHHVHDVTSAELESGPDKILDAFDEPFADSSAVLVNMLSEFASRHVKVALSGDGADEVFGGYNKHRAILKSLRGGALNHTIRRALPLLCVLPASRNGSWGNNFRQLQRYGKGLQLDFNERYWAWACFTYPAEVAALLRGSMPARPPFIDALLGGLDPREFNSVLRTDMQLVLANDMLYKVDSMSMHHGLEVRVPFLDHRVVDYAFSLPASTKMDGKIGKRLLRETFASEFPTDHFPIRKKGFEAPLMHWFGGPLRTLLDELLHRERLGDEGIFDPEAVISLRRRMASKSPGDSPHTLWALLVFQYWKAKYIDQSLPSTT